MYIGINLLYALTWMGQTVVLQYLFDIAQRRVGGLEDAYVLPRAVLLMGSAYLLYHLLDGINNCYTEILFLKAFGKLNGILFGRIARMNAAEFEDAGRLDAVEKARAGSMWVPGIFSVVIDVLTYYIPYFVFMGWYLFRQSPVLIASILIVFLPTMLSKLAISVRFRELEEAEAPLRRELAYYEKCLTGREYLKETRMFGANGFFEKRYGETLKWTNHLRTQVLLRQNLLQTGLKTVTALGYGLIIWLLFRSVAEGRITVGVFAAVLTTMSNLFRFMDKMVMERLGMAAENIGTVGNFLDFLREEKEAGSQKKRLPGRDITLERVSFAYPQAQGKALTDISLTIKSGQIVALVGENGSGKTTLARVLSGLYAPTEGSIRYGEEPLETFTAEGVSAVFQNFSRYQMTLGENLSIGNRLKRDEERMRKLCGEVDICLDETQGGIGLDEMLGREFGGTDVSGGQWQRIAIGRGIYREHDMMLLDEPTAAIDPKEESNLYRKFAQICKGKTAILITHRLGATRLADRIIVLKEGRVVQDGSWEELVEREGAFREMYEAQRHWYEK